MINHSLPPTRDTPSPAHSIVDVTEDQGLFNRNDTYQSNRRVFQNINEIKSVKFDNDEDKYKRKSVFGLVGNWWK